LVEGDFPGPLEWIDPDQSLFVKGVDDLPNLTDEQLDELKLALEAIGFTGENIPNSGNATRPKRTAREGGKSDSASAGVETVAEDPSRAPVHERILARMTEIGVETRFNISTGYQEFRGGFVGKDWRPANDRITARILSDVPGRPIGIARGRQAFGTILCDREVIPQGEHLGNVPPTNDTTVYEELLKDRFIAECRPEYATAVLRSFMFSVARMNLRPGHAQEFLPVLMGSRRSAISALLRGLCPDPRWYTNSIPFAGRGRKPSEAMRGKMIGEVPLDELDSAAASTLDAVVTHDTAHPQMPVAGGPDDFPPLCGLIGTAFNLVSLDGGIKVNPHLLPVPIETELPDHEVEQWARENADRFWGLARNDHESGRLPADMLVETLEMREETVDRLRAGDELRYGSIERHVRSLAPGDQFSLAELFCAVEIPRRGGDDNLVADFLKKELGFEKSEQKRHNDKRTMVWTVPEEIRPSDGSGPDRQKPARRKG